MTRVVILNKFDNQLPQNANMAKWATALIQPLPYQFEYFSLVTAAYDTRGNK